MLPWMSLRLCGGEEARQGGGAVGLGVGSRTGLKGRVRVQS